MSHRLASQQSKANASLSKRLAADRLQAYSDWLNSVDADHVQEWRASGVDPDIIALNVETLTDTATNSYAESLFPIAERLHWKVARFGQKTRANLRGWWVSGIDPLNQWQRMSWGRFKPDAATPVLDREKGKPAKYLSPSLGHGSSRLVLLDVPPRLWDKVAQRYSLSVAACDRPLGFWHWVWKANVPVILTEGEKKAGCLLTQGYAAIALPGIFNGYRKDTRRLIPELDHFATSERSVTICFDYETKPKTIKDINLATTKLGKLLRDAGCVVNILSLPGPQKGVDDFIVAQGQQPFESLYASALSLEFWLATKLWALTYTPSLTLKTPYLDNLPYPSTGLVCIKSAKGTGKTTALQALIREATRTGRKVLVITHRIQLGRAICESIGIDWIEEVKESATQGLFGYGLCIDSLHSTSQARFNPQFWKGAIVILDEVEQVLWHALNSSTCYDHRVKILETLRELVQTTLSSDGLIIAQDADLSDVSIDYLKGLVEEPIEPWLVINHWQPERGWDVSFYDTKNPAPLVTRMEAFLEQGAIFVALDSQKVSGRWSSKNLETYLQCHYPAKRILRIDSESVADPQHPAYGIVERLNQAITHYDIVLATPTIGTGVSIDVRGHFKAVFGIFQGSTPDAESRQALARVREPVPRFVWTACFGPGKVGNGSCSYQDVIHSTTKAVKYNIALLKEVDFDIDAQTDPITLRSWAKMAARVNVSLWSYRNECRNGLVMEGHQVTTVTDDLLNRLPTAFQALCTDLAELFGAADIAQTLQADLLKGVLQFPGVEYLPWQHQESTAALVTQNIKAVQERSRLREAQAIATAPDLTPPEYDSLKDQRAKTVAERYAQHKHELQRRYPIPVTPELKIKDDEGWYAQLRLHYYLTHDPAFVRLRDLKEWQGHLDRGDGKVALQDVRLLTSQVETFKVLGLLHLLDSERPVRANDAEVEQLHQAANQYAYDIKAVLNLTISKKMTPIAVVQALLSKLGLKLTCIGRDIAPDGRRGGLRVYQYLPPDDDRDTIFTQWQQRDVIAQVKQREEERAAVLPQLPGIDPDPPPDKSGLNQSFGGTSEGENALRKQSKAPMESVLLQEPFFVQARSEVPHQIPKIQPGSLVKLVGQACWWVVTYLEETFVELKELHGVLECTVLKRDVLLSFREGIP
ncbi:MAG: plasmid replication protein, CyRepA1 family (plasmid) [Leptolyngbya sp. BL-A-14]